MATFGLPETAVDLGGETGSEDWVRVNLQNLSVEEIPIMESAYADNGKALEALHSSLEKAS